MCLRFLFVNCRGYIYFVFRFLNLFWYLYILRYIFWIGCKLLKRLFFLFVFLKFVFLYFRVSWRNTKKIKCGVKAETWVSVRFRRWLQWRGCKFETTETRTRNILWWAATAKCRQGLGGVIIISKRCSEKTRGFKTKSKLFLKSASVITNTKNVCKTKWITYTNCICQIWKIFYNRDF